MTKKEIIELYLADLGNLVANSDAKRSRIIDLENELKMLNQNNIKQTAVEWLVEELLENFNIEYEIIEQAKAMEKEQIIDTARYYFHERGKLTAEQYYNETFKSTFNEQVNEVGMEGHENGCGCWMCNDLRGLSTIKSE